jgi:hypothetical protein
MPHVRRRALYPHGCPGILQGAQRRFFVKRYSAKRLFAKNYKTPKKYHCCQKFHRAIAGKQAILPADNHHAEEFHAKAE